MDPSIVKLLEDDEDETMHSGVDLEAFQAALNRDIGGDASAPQPSGSDAVLSQGSNSTFSQSIPQWPTSSHDNRTDNQNQEPKPAQQQEQPSSDVEQKQHGSLVEQSQHVDSQVVNNPPLSQKQSQDECHQAQTAQVSLQNSQMIGIQNSGKDPVVNHEVVQTHNPSSESQYAKLQQMSNQQDAITEQPSSQINRSKQVPFGLLLPILIPQLPKDTAMHLQALFTKLKKDEIPKDSFVRHMKGIVGDQMLRIALTKVQSQTRPNQGPAGQQLPVRMPTVGSGARQLNDPHALAQLHQRSMNAAADQSRMDAKIESQGLQTSQFPSSTSSQETERSSVHMQGLNKQQQQHLHFSSAYGSSAGNYNLFSGTTNSSSSSLKPQLLDSHLSQTPHQSTGPNHLGGATQGLNVIGMPKLEQQNSFSDPKRLPGGSMSPMVNNAASQQTSNAWQPPINKEQNVGLLSSMSYVKKEPSDLSTEQQHRLNLSKLHGLPSAQIEQGRANLGILKDEFSRGLPASTSMPPTTSTGSLPLNSASPSVTNQLDPSTSVMAPPKNTAVEKQPVKRKKHASAQGDDIELPSGPGASSRATSYSPRFRSPDHRKHWDLVVRKEMVLERRVSLVGNNYASVSEQIRNRGWEVLADLPHRYDIKLVHEFYANALKLEVSDPSCVTEVQGVPITFTASDINSCLGIPIREEACEYEQLPAVQALAQAIVDTCCVQGAAWEMGTSGNLLRLRRQDLTPNAKVWSAFLHANLRVSSHESTVTAARAHLLYGILTGRTINVGGVIATDIQMKANSRVLKESLGHGLLITELIRRAGVPVSTVMEKVPRQPIDREYIRRFCYLAPAPPRRPPPLPTQRPRSTDMALLLQNQQAMRRHQEVLREFFREMSLAQQEGRVPVCPFEEELSPRLGWQDYPGDQGAMPQGGCPRDQRMRRHRRKRDLFLLFRGLLRILGSFGILILSPNPLIRF